RARCARPDGWGGGVSGRRDALLLRTHPPPSLPRAAGGGVDPATSPPRAASASGSLPREAGGGAQEPSRPLQTPPGATTVQCALPSKRAPLAPFFIAGAPIPAPARSPSQSPEPQCSIACSPASSAAATTASSNSSAASSR